MNFEFVLLQWESGRKGKITDNINDVGAGFTLQSLETQIEDFEGKNWLSEVAKWNLNENPPYTHRLVFLTEKVPLDLTEGQLELFETITDFNMEARYPDEKFSFKKRCTRDFTEKYLNEIGEVRKWLLQMIPS